MKVLPDDDRLYAASALKLNLERRLDLLRPAADLLLRRQELLAEFHEQEERIAAFEARHGPMIEFIKFIEDQERQGDAQHKTP